MLTANIIKMLKFVNKLFGSASQKQIKSFSKIIDNINNFEEKVNKLSDSELKGKTIYFKDLISNGKTLDEILPEVFQNIARGLPLVYIFEEARSILVTNVVNYDNIKNAFMLNSLYLFLGIFLFYYSFAQARKKGSLINIGE